MHSAETPKFLASYYPSLYIFVLYKEYRYLTVICLRGSQTDRTLIGIYVKTKEERKEREGERKRGGKEEK